MSSLNIKAVRLMTLAALALSGSCRVVAAQAPPNAGNNAAGSPSIVKVVETAGAFRLVRNGKPYFIEGGGGDGSKTLLHSLGGNSVRTWGVDNLGPVLDEAQKLGMTVTVGIWLGHKEHGFDYANPDQVADQYETARQAILRYRNHPALLMWGIGNEMEMGLDGKDAAMWSAVNNIAALAKKIDPNHPTMTVIAEIGGDKVKHIHRLCPDIDVIGINSYAGGPSIPERYKQAGGTKPYVLTEYGPPGVWEIGKNAWGAGLEPTSTEKAAMYRSTYEKAIAGQNLCLGGYAFTWGHKQEATATWFGLLLPDGSRLGATDALAELWSGKLPANRCPVLRSLSVEGSNQTAPNAMLHAALDTSDPDSDPLTVQWILQRDSQQYNIGGERENVPTIATEAITASDNRSATIKMPAKPGAYRLFAYVRDNHGGAAVANVPILAKGANDGTPATNTTTAANPDSAPKLAPAALPFVVYGETGQSASTFVPSGYMGNTAAIKMDENCATQPHTGTTCIRAQFTSGDGWGGVVWQSPANDWGDKPGGKNLTGATRLTFWARGENGGETVNFLCGVIGREKPFFDTAQVKREKTVLTTGWKKYALDLKGQNLSRIKTGFGWTLAGNGSPITFYLDDIRFETDGDKAEQAAK